MVSGDYCGVVSGNVDFSSDLARFSLKKGGEAIESPVDTDALPFGVYCLRT